MQRGPFRTVNLARILADQCRRQSNPHELRLSASKGSTGHQGVCPSGLIQCPSQDRAVAGRWSRHSLLSRLDRHRGPSGERQGRWSDMRRLWIWRCACLHPEHAVRSAALLWQAPQTLNDAAEERVHNGPGYGCLSLDAGSNQACDEFTRGFRDQRFIRSARLWIQRTESASV